MIRATGAIVNISKCIKRISNKDIKNVIINIFMSIKLSFNKSDFIENFITFNRFEREKIIKIGMDVFQYIKKEKLTNDELQNLLTIETEKFESEKTDLQTEYNIKLDQSIQIYKQEKNQLEQKLLNSNDKQRDYWLQREQQIRNDYEQQLDIERKKYESTFLHTQNSTILGQDGEDFTLQKLNLLFPSSEIEDCHNESGRGDFILHKGDFHMMIETKNYTKNVLKNEVTKFYRDVDTNEDIQCAILVSLKSGICAKPDFHFEVRNKKPVLFLHNITDNVDNIKIAVQFFQLILENNIDINNKEILEKIKNIVPAVKRIFRKQKKQICTFQKNMNTSIQDMETSIVELFKLICIKY